METILQFKDVASCLPGANKLFLNEVGKPACGWICRGYPVLVLISNNDRKDQWVHHESPCVDTSFNVYTLFLLLKIHTMNLTVL